MPNAIVRVTRPTRQFWLLAIFLIVVFLTGGSSRSDVPSLQWLRPIAALVFACGLFTIRIQHLRQYRHIAFLSIAVVGLTTLHLILLPPSIWHNLPGRAVLQDIDGLVGVKDQWRPLSMVPEATANAFYSLIIPLAVLTLVSQFGMRDHIYLLGLMLVLFLASGTLGLLQAVGIDLAFFEKSSEIAGVFANRNHQGVLLAMLFPMLAVATIMAGALGLQRRLALILASAFALIAIPLVIITGSRAGLIASVIAALLVPLIAIQGFRVTTARNRWSIVGQVMLFSTVIVVLVWLTLFASRGTAISRMEAYQDDLRYPVWGSIIDVLPTYLPWGSGIGSYVNVYQIYEPAALLRPNFSNHAHSEWLEIAMTAGVPGLLLLAWAIVLFIYAVRKAFRSKGLPAAISRLGLGMILILSFASTLDYPIRTPIMASVFAIAAIWAASFGRFGIENDRP